MKHDTVDTCGMGHAYSDIHEEAGEPPATIQHTYGLRSLGLVQADRVVRSRARQFSPHSSFNTLAREADAKIV